MISSIKRFSDTKVITMPPKANKNLKYLRQLAYDVKNFMKDKDGNLIDHKQKARNILKLYETRKIENFRTAENVLVRLGNSRIVKSGNADREYDKVVKKYSDALPATGKLEREREPEEKKQCVLSDLDFV